MPKASKRQKEKKADFQKTKLKLGKGKQAANNATDTSFKAKTIALPQQSINADKSGKLVNSRNLTVADLALQLRHYSAGVRRDAIAGIKEILTLHPSLMLSAAPQLVPELSRCIGDDDGIVRKQLHLLLAWMLPEIPQQLLGPYHNTLLLYTTSALSHIYPEVRLDAIKVLDVCLDVLPHAATSGWQDAVFNMSKSTTSTATNLVAAGPSTSAHQPHGERIMNCFLNLLGVTRRSGNAASTTATDLAPAAKLLILRSLRAFLSHALPATSSGGDDHSSRCPTWFFRSAFASTAEFEHFESLLGKYTSANRTRTLSVYASVAKDHSHPDVNSSSTNQASLSHWTDSEMSTSTLMDLDSTSGTSVQQSDLFVSLQAALSSATSAVSSATGSLASQSAALALYELLDSILLASFLDTAPAAFQPDLDLSHQVRGQNVGLSTPSQLIFEIIQLLLSLWRGASAPTSKARISLANMLGHASIYFPFSSHTGSSTLSHKAKSLVVQMDLAYAELAALFAINTADSQKNKYKFNVDVQVAAVAAFVSELLAVPVTEQGTVSLGSVTGSAASVLDADTFHALLPTLWFLLGAEHETLLDSLLTAYQTYSTQHRVKPILFEFLARAYLLSKLRAQTPFSQAESDRILQTLLSGLPRNLWEAASSSSGHAFAGLQLELLHFVLVLPSPPGTLEFGKLVPFYWVTHPTKKVSGPGPFSKLPSLLRKLALDNSVLLQHCDGRLDKAISSARQSVIRSS